MARDECPLGNEYASGPLFVPNAMSLVRFWRGLGLRTINFSVAITATSAIKPLFY